MKTLLVTIGMLAAVNSFCQTYNVGLVKMGPDIKELEGLIIISDSTVTAKFDGHSSVLKITSRNGFTFHVTDGKSPGKYVITHASGRIHGFTFDRHITYHPEKRHAGYVNSVFYGMIQRN